MLGVDIRYAIGASLVSVIATSSGAAAAYVRDGLSNIRIGMFLELATTIGAICGALLASRIPTKVLAVIFGIVLLHSAWQTSQMRKETGIAVNSSPLADRLKLNGIYKTRTGSTPYSVSHPAPGFGLMYVAGMLSGLLGIGSGALKVIAMDRIMGIPFKVSTATSSFMIGVTGVCQRRNLSEARIHSPRNRPAGHARRSRRIDGRTRLLPRLPVPLLRRLFAVVVGVIALQMIIEGLERKGLGMDIQDKQLQQLISVTLRSGVLIAGDPGPSGRSRLPQLPLWRRSIVRHLHWHPISLRLSKGHRSMKHSSRRRKTQ